MWSKLFSKYKEFKKKTPAFCVRSSMFELKPYRNSFKSCHQLPDKKVEEKWTKKVNVECDTDENLKDYQGYFTVYPANMFCLELRAKFLHQNLFFSSILFLFTLIYCIKGYSVKRQFILQLNFNLFPYKIRKI
jgi:hypothetical protein